MFRSLAMTLLKRKQRLYCLIILMASSAPSLAAEKLFTLVTAPYPPYNYVDNATKGLNIDIIKAAFAQQGYRVDVSILPFSRALKMAKAGDADGITLWHTQQREQWFAFSYAFTRSELVFFKPKSLPFTYTDITSLDNLSSYIVGTVQDYAYPSALLSHPNITKAAVISDQQNIKKLVFNRINVAIIDHKVAKYLMTQLFPEKQALYESAGTLKYENYYLAVSKLTPKYQQKLIAFNRGLEAIRQNGELAAIIQKYQ